MARIPRRGIKLPKTKQPCGHGWDELDQGCTACINEFQAAQAGVIAELNKKVKALTDMWTEQCEETKRQRAKLKGKSK
jgi:hypothetical protein